MQTSRQALTETLIGTAVGFILSLLVWQFVVRPFWGLQTTFVSNLNITLLFTVVSIARGYVVRRFFNMLTHKNNKSHKHENTTTAGDSRTG
jgi:predicted membrane protein